MRTVKSNSCRNIEAHWEKLVGGGHFGIDFNKTVHCARFLLLGRYLGSSGYSGRGSRGNETSLLEAIQKTFSGDPRPMGVGGGLHFLQSFLALSRPMCCNRDE